MELAKEKAIDALTKARNLSPNNHAVFLAYASYYMQLEDLKNAKEAVLQCLNIWEPIMVRIREKVTEEFSNREEEIEEDVMEEQILAKCELYVLDCESIGLLPNAENRLTVAKILYDVDEITRCDELINRELNLRVEDFEVHYLKARTSEKFGKFDDVRHSVLAAVYYGIDSGEIDVDSIGEVRDDLKELYVKANGDSDHIDRVISGALNGADPVELFQELDSSSSD